MSVLRIALGTALILLIPLVLRFPWSLFDFVIAGVLLMGTGFTFELVSRRLGSKKHKVVFGIVLAVVFALIWAELAVGLFGSPFAGS